VLSHDRAEQEQRKCHTVPARQVADLFASAPDRGEM